jgi:hypothetical protein
MDTGSERVKSIQEWNAIKLKKYTSKENYLLKKS